MTARRPSHRVPACRRLLWGCGLALAALACGREASPGRWLPGEMPFAPRSETLGAYEVRLEGTGWQDARLRAFRRDRPDDAVFETVPGMAFLEIARGRASLRGAGAAARVEDDVQERCADLSIDAIEAELYVLHFVGRFRCAVLDRSFELFVVPAGRSELRFHLRLADASFNRIALVQARDPAERFFGLGARAATDLDGRRWAVWVTPRGGVRPGVAERLTRLLPGASPELAPGSPASVPHLLSSRGRALLLESPEYSVFDLRAADRVRIEAFTHELTWRVQSGATPLDLVAVATAAAGRIEPLPAWAEAGPIVELGGGADRVRARLEALAAAGVVPAAVELRDWAAEGALEPDPSRYPAARSFVAELRNSGVRVLVEVSPRIPVEPEGRAMAELVERADTAGYWVRDLDGVPFERDGTRWLDLSNPDARSAWVDGLQTAVLDYGVAGWLLRDGGSLPFAARLAADVAAADYHNPYADAAVRASGRALREAEHPVEGVVLTETGFVRSPGHGAVLLVGEAGEPETWSRLLSAGLSGYALAAVDVGPASSGEALERALAAAAFAPVFRVRDEALDTPGALEALARATRVHAAWSGYRAELVRRAHETGAPILRPPWLEHPGEIEPARADGRTFFVGDQLLVAPVFEPGSERVEIRLPAGRWIDAYSGTAYGDPERAADVALGVPLGRTALLYSEGSIVGPRLREALADGS